MITIKHWFIEHIFASTGLQQVDNLFKEEAKLYADNGFCGKELHRSEFGKHYLKIDLLQVLYD
jgi:hypothetical protein